MPQELHNQLVKRANELGLTGERRNAYIYGAMSRIEKGKKKSKHKGDKP